MTGQTLYQCYKALARLIEFQAYPEAIAEQSSATRAATRAAKLDVAVSDTRVQKLMQFGRVSARLSARAIRVARRERAAHG